MSYFLDGTRREPGTSSFRDAVEGEKVVVAFPASTVIEAGPKLGDWISNSTTHLREDAGAEQVKIWIKGKGRGGSP
jgi:hypothetical protein